MSRSSSGPGRPDALPRQVSSFIAEDGLVSPGDVVLAGVSGGPDSVALALLLADLLPSMGGRMAILHFNHRLRGDESDGDQAFVENLAGQLGVSCLTGTSGGSRPAGRSLQEWARRERLAFFRRARKEAGAASVALAHTLDDQAETILMRLLFAGGPGALGGIRPRGPHRIIHPLLRVRRGDLLAFLEERRQPWRTDSSNRKDVYLRNRIRHELMPVIDRVAPSFPRRLADLCAVMQEEDRLLEELVRASMPAPPSARGGSLLDVDGLGALPRPLQRRAIVSACREAGVRRKDLRLSHVEAVRGLLSAARGASLDLPGARAVRRGREIVIEKADPPPARPVVDEPLNVPGETRIEALGIDVSITEEPCPAVEVIRQCGRDRAYLDPSRISGQLRVRTVRAGDRFYPLGAGGSRTLKRFLIDQRVDRDQKGRVPVFWDDEKIVWVGGYRIDDRVRLREDTRRALRISLLYGGTA